MGEGRVRWKGGEGSRDGREGKDRGMEERRERGGRDGRRERRREGDQGRVGAIQTIILYNVTQTQFRCTHPIMLPPCNKCGCCDVGR